MDWKKNRGRKNKKKKLENRYNLFIFGWVERAMKYQEKKKMILDGTFSQKENKFLLFMTLLK